MVIYMDQHRASAMAPVHGMQTGDYGDEIMDANWNPSVVHLHDVTHSAISHELPEDLSTIDVDAFLDRVYALATQI